SWYIALFFSSRRRHTRSKRDWSSDVCSSDLHSPYQVQYVLYVPLHNSKIPTDHIFGQHHQTSDHLMEYHVQIMMQIELLQLVSQVAFAFLNPFLAYCHHMLLMGKITQALIYFL